MINNELYYHNEGLSNVEDDKVGYNEPMKIYLKSIGCRLNQSEIETMARQLLASGHEIVSSLDEADKVIINTCAVTGQAAKDSRAIFNRSRRRNEDAELFATGCYATIEPEAFREVNGKGHIIANSDKNNLVQLIDESAPESPYAFDREPILRSYLAGRMGNTRAFVKVQDGCDNRCTFCVTTIARGYGRSRPMPEVLEEIQALTVAGYQEAVLTGVHLGSYGRDLEEDAGLAELIRGILHHTDLPRLRISSLEPWDIEPGFFELWSHLRLLPHIHMPLQSGSDKILRRMARRTTRSSFRKLVSTARSSIQDLSLTTDIIAGFPGEMDYEFQESLDFVSEMNFSRLHVFSFSQRTGTAANDMDGQVPREVAKSRVREMIALGRALSLDHHMNYRGRELNVLWESATVDQAGDRLWRGYSDNYIRVTTREPTDLFNRVTPTILANPEPGGMTGSIVTQ
jgi:threonylcarbamoyladenosine tRNA methylthiotransferase MtaB